MGGGGGVRVGATATGAELGAGGTGVEEGAGGIGVEVGTAGGVAHETKCSKTKAHPVICSDSLLRFITSSLKLDVGLAAASVRAGHPT